MKVVDVDMKQTRMSARKLRRDRPTAPLMCVNLRVPEALYLRIEERAKSSFRTVAQEINFRVARDLDAEEDRKT
jgi:hypothetical protein